MGCYTCGQDGHFVRDCPQRAGAAANNNNNNSNNYNNGYQRYNGLTWQQKKDVEDIAWMRELCADIAKHKKEREEQEKEQERLRIEEDRRKKEEEQHRQIERQAEIRDARLMAAMTSQHKAQHDKLAMQMDEVRSRIHTRDTQREDTKKLRGEVFKLERELAKEDSPKKEEELRRKLVQLRKLKEERDLARVRKKTMEAEIESQKKNPIIDNETLIAGWQDITRNGAGNNVVDFCMNMRSYLRTKSMAELQCLCGEENMEYVTREKAIKSLISNKMQEKILRGNAGSAVGPNPEVGDVVKEKIGDLKMSEEITAIVRRHVRVVWIQKQTVGDVLHNHREYARSNGSICVCADCPFPLVEGHVQCGLSELGAPDFLLNARNIPPQRTKEVRRGIMAAILDGLEEIFRGAGRTLTVHKMEFELCVEEQDVPREDNYQLLLDWKRRLRGLRLWRRVASIKARHDAEIAREKLKKEGEEKLKKEKDEEEKRLRKQKDREELQKMIGETLEVRLKGTGVSEIPKNPNGEVEKLRAEIEEMKRAQVAARSGGSLESDEVHRLRMEIALLKRRLSTGRKDDGDRRSAAVREDAWRNVQESYEQRMATLEEQVTILRRMKDDAVNEAEAWKLEAQRPGNKRGGVTIGVTPGTRARVRSRCTPTQTIAPPKKMMLEEYRDFVQLHEDEVNLLKDMRSKEVQRRKEAEEEAERVKEQLARLEIERADKHKTTATCLRARLEAAIDDDVGPSSRGKRHASVSKKDTMRSDRTTNEGSFAQGKSSPLETFEEGCHFGDM
ncbi:hypothetical protein CBR_g48283 [Chara braunii]|uniref:CCHC-type domain-containing protein n=1 Tax=Chara braunii TaxID=69332 RepID=A0A388M2M4_CHABU|nr:hypothetical protein CBR_g48283 [Chara braunii]|eukprot:GBG88755.1 hypothetical protein CBR_g48283 [Chara braunii]